LPHGGRLVTLADAGNFITRLPEAEHETPEWQQAMETLILVATLGGPAVTPTVRVHSGPQLNACMAGAVWDSAGGRPFVAGNETTRHLLSGGLQILSEHPDQRDRLFHDVIARLFGSDHRELGCEVLSHSPSDG